MSIVFNLEEPRIHVVQYGSVFVSGWAFSTDSDIETVNVYMDGVLYVSHYGGKRKDVADAYKKFSSKAMFSGFEINIDNISNSKKHTLRVVIIETSGKKIKKSIKLISNDYQEGKIEKFIWLAKKSYTYAKDHNFIISFDKLKKGARLIKGIALQSQNEFIPKKNEDLYELWQNNHRISTRIRKLYIKNIRTYGYHPLISIIMPAYNTDIQLLEKAIGSVEKQIYDNWELIIWDDGSSNDNVKKVCSRKSEDQRIKFYRSEENKNISLATNAAVSKAAGEYLFFMDHDDVITEDALYEVVSALNANREIDIIYSDDDKISMNDDLYAPQFKPDYSPELLLSYMYFSHIFVLKKEVFELAGGCRQGFEGAQDYDLALRVTEHTNKVKHIPKILYHWRATPLSTAKSASTKPKSIERGLNAVKDAVKRRGINADVYQPDFAEKNNLGIYSLTFTGEDEPLVSIVIPTKNHVDDLKRCIESITDRTVYKNYEIVIVDNCSDEKETLEYLNSLREKHKILSVKNVDGKFNFSHMVNEGVRASSGDFVLLLNNDTEVINPNWLNYMMAYKTIDGVGAVGAKLLYPDGRVQHAGVVIKMFNGIAGHAFKLINKDDGGYLSYASVSRNYSAVTGACLLTDRKTYWSVDGFDEEKLAVSFNDVDYCLKVKDKGLRIVFAGEAVLYHHEGKSRGTEQTGHYSDAKEVYEMNKKWQLPKYSDEFYNTNLSLDNELFLINPNSSYSSDKLSLNILTVSHNMNYEGAPLLQLAICKGLLKKGYNFLVISPEDGPLKKVYEDIGIKVIVDSNISVRNIDSAKFIDKLSENYQGIVADYKIDLFYVNTVEMFHMTKVANLIGVPVMWAIHESADPSNKFLELGNEVQRLFLDSLSKSTSVVFVAKATSDVYKKYLNNNYTVIKNGFDIKRVEEYKKEHNDELKKELGIKKSEKIVSIVGTICRRKGQLDFVKAAKYIVDNDKQNEYRFLIVGAGDESYLRSVKRQIESNNISDRVIIILAPEDVYKYYLASDVFVCASYEESSPMVILEAMAFNVPVVSTNVFGIPEIITDRKDGILIDSGDIKAMGKGVIALANDYELKSNIVSNGYYNLLTNHDKDTMIGCYKKVFEDIYFNGKV